MITLNNVQVVESCKKIDWESIRAQIIESLGIPVMRTGIIYYLIADCKTEKCKSL